MSAEKVEILKRLIDAFNDRSDLLGQPEQARAATFDEIFCPDVEWSSGLAGAVESGTYRGREGIEQYFDELGEAFEDVLLIGEKFCDLGEQVLSVIRIEARGRGSGVPVTSRQTLLADFRGGRVSRGRAFLDHSEALRAAGLETPSPPPARSP